MTEAPSIEMSHSLVKEGVVYVLTNASMPGIVKIGFTAGNPDKRAKRISSEHDGPGEFIVAEYVRTKDPYIVEQRVHEELAAFRQTGEFFECGVTLALETISKWKQ